MLRDFPQAEGGTWHFAEVVAGKEGYRMVVYDKKTGELVSEGMESGSLREFDDCISIFVDKFDLFSYDSEKRNMFVPMVPSFIAASLVEV